MCHARPDGEDLRLININPNARAERFDFNNEYALTGRSLLLFELIKEEE